MMTLLLGLAAHATGLATCQDGRIHATIADAAADPACAEVTLEDDVYTELVRVERDLMVRGAGMDKSFVACLRGPCFDVRPNAKLTLEDVTVASDGSALLVQYGELRATRSRLAPLYDIGGRLWSRDSDITLTHTEVHVARHYPEPVQAVSSRGHDMLLQDVSFLGSPRRPGTPGVVFSVAYGVTCTECRFDPVKARLEIPQVYAALEPGSDPRLRPHGLSGQNRWPSLYCPSAKPHHQATCAELCGPNAVAACRMLYETRSESCVPSPVCVSASESLF